MPASTEHQLSNTTPDFHKALRDPAPSRAAETRLLGDAELDHVSGGKRSPQDHEYNRFPIVQF
jgi:hypothetical protein